MLVCFIIVNADVIGGTSRPLASPADESKMTKRVQGWLCKFKYTVSLSSIASFGSLASVGLALLFCFSLIRRSLSIVTTWNQQYNMYFRKNILLLKIKQNLLYLPLFCRKIAIFYFWLPIIQILKQIFLYIYRLENLINLESKNRSTLEKCFKYFKGSTFF